MTWKFSDGTTLEPGGWIHGKGPAAAYLKAALAEEHEINVLPAPAGRVVVVPTSAYLLDLLAKYVAYALRQTLTTDYMPNIGDAPAEVQTDDPTVQDRASSYLLI